MSPITPFVKIIALERPLVLRICKMRRSEVGLSTVTKLAPARLAGLMMGVWFLSISAGNYLGGWIAGFYDATAQGTIARLFGGVAIGTLIAAGILAALTPFIRGLMGRVR